MRVLASKSIELVKKSDKLFFYCSFRPVSEAVNTLDGTVRKIPPIN